MQETEDFRSTSGRVLTIASTVIAIAVIVAIALSDGWNGLLHFGAIPLLFAALVWAIFGRPFLRVSDGGVEIGNVLRLIHVPWPAVTELDRRWGLRVVTAFGKYTAWSVPAPKRPSFGSTFVGGTRVMEQKASQSAASLLDNGARDAPKGRTESKAAIAVAARWEKLKSAGHLDSPRLDAAKPTYRWNTDVIVVCAVLIILAAIGVATGS